MVSLYFRRGTIARTSAYSHCRICGKNNGSYEFSDGTYLWLEGLAHYLDDHAVRLPAEIVHHAMLRLDEVLHAEIDRTWWLSAVAQP